MIPKIKAILIFSAKVYGATVVAQAIFKYAPIPDSVKNIILDPVGFLLGKLK